MAPPLRGLIVGAALVVGLPGVAWAGMPAITLSDVARLRIQTISFFLVCLLVSSWFVQLLWNYLRHDFSRLPRLTYGKALSIVVLWGLLFVLVLTMISGARELMTPGAWRKEGFTYRLNEDRPPPPAPGPSLEHERERRQKLAALRDALWNYARSHEGSFPPGDSVTQIPADLWQMSGTSGQRYLYVPGLTAYRGSVPLVYEPARGDDLRLVLLTDGTIRPMPLEEIVQALPAEKP
jgi:hypothetical protein